MGYYSNHSTSKETKEKQKRERLGEERLNNQGCLMKIIEYNMANDIVVEFQDEFKSRIQTRYSMFQKGEIRNPYHSNVFGGMTGNKYPVKVNGKTIKEYSTWHNMLDKCANNKEYTIFKEWLFYENFYEWLHEQENFDKWYVGARWNLCNSIVDGNKEYSPEMCYLIPYNLKQMLMRLNINKDNLSEYLIEKHKKFTEFKVKQVAKEELLKGNITSKCYEAIKSRLNT